ncbi:MAG: cbb3-type cytochrome oxidase subunit 3 [Parahaliea sp.]
MTALWGNLIGAGIIVLMFCFVAIWFWAWRPRHQNNFKRMAHLPMEDHHLAESVEEVPKT